MAQEEPGSRDVLRSASRVYARFSGRLVVDAPILACVTPPVEPRHVASAPAPIPRLPRFIVHAALLGLSSRLFVPTRRVGAGTVCQGVAAEEKCHVAEEMPTE